MNTYFKCIHLNPWENTNAQHKIASYIPAVVSMNHTSGYIATSCIISLVAIDIMTNI